MILASLFSYIPVEQIMPVASTMAAAVGVVLMFGRAAIGFPMKVFASLYGKATGVRHGNPILSHPALADESLSETVTASQSMQQAA